MLYTSELTGKSYKTVEELTEAENAYRKANEEKMKALDEKKKRAEEVKLAYEDYLNVKRKAAEMVAEAEKKYYELRAQFAKDYNGYHMTYINTNGKEEVTFGDLLDLMFKGW